MYLTQTAVKKDHGVRNNKIDLKFYAQTRIVQTNRIKMMTKAKIQDKIQDKIRMRIRIRMRIKNKIQHVK